MFSLFVDRGWKWLLGVVGVLAVVYLAGGFKSRDERYAERIARAGEITRERRFDAAVLDFARRYVVEANDGKRDPLLEAAAVAAVQDGCTDPFVRYLVFRVHADSVYVNPGVPAVDDLAAEISAILQEFCGLPYPDGVRALVAYRAWRCVRFASKGAQLPAISRNIHAIAQGGALAAIRDRSTPDSFVWLLAVRTEDYFGTDPDWRSSSERALDPVLASRSGSKAFQHYLRGTRAVQRAWEARGNGFAHEVTQEGWKQFRAGLETARTELETAWAEGFRHIMVAESMIKVCMGECSPPEEMEQWFARGLATGQGAEQLCRNKVWYLDERWHGSLDTCLAFARECLIHPEWGPRVALTLWETHRGHRSLCKLPESYFARPEVWRDIKESFTTFLAANPNATADRVLFVYCAWLAKDWTVVREQLPMADPRTTMETSLFGPEGIGRVRADLAKATGS